MATFPSTTILVLPYSGNLSRAKLSRLAESRIFSIKTFVNCRETTVCGCGRYQHLHATLSTCQTGRRSCCSTNSYCHAREREATSIILTLSPWSRTMTRPLILTTSYWMKIFSVGTLQIAPNHEIRKSFDPKKDSRYTVFPDGQLTKCFMIALHK